MQTTTFSVSAPKTDANKSTENYHTKTYETKDADTFLFERESLNRLPVLLQAIHFIDLSAVKFILEECPECLVVFSNKERSHCHPLHLAVEKAAEQDQPGPRLAILRLLLKTFCRFNGTVPSMRLIRNGVFPIHLACQKRCDLPIFRCLLTAMPHSVYMEAVGQSYREFEGYLPIHHAIACGCSVDVVMLLTELAPSSLLMFSAGNLHQPPLLPVHVAATMRHKEPRRNCHLLMELVNVCPKALALKMKDGGTALHYAMEHAHNSDFGLNALKTVYRKYQHAAHIADNNGCCPIHLAVTRNDFVASVVVRILMENHPDTLLLKNANGRLPLHMLASMTPDWASRQRHGQSNQLLCRMVELNPVTLRHVDKSGKLPLHQACQSGQHHSVIQCFVETFPESIDIEDNQGMPLLAACESGSLDVIFLLLQKSPELFQHVKGTTIVQT